MKLCAQLPTATRAAGLGAWHRTPTSACKVMARVAPEAPRDLSAAPALKKPLGGRGGAPLLTAYDPAYLQRKVALGEQICQTKSGKRVGYFTEGNPSDPALLLLHPLTNSKWYGVFPKPIPGVYLISPDRLGNGDSSPIDSSITWGEMVAPMIELLDELKVDKFYVAGHSYGAAMAIQVAAALPDRVLGCAAVSAPAIGYYEGATTHLPKADRTPGLIFALSQPGCWGGFSRWLLGMVFKAQYFADKTKDPGFKASYGRMQQSACGGTVQAWERMDKDPFLMTKLCDGPLHGCNQPLTARHELQCLHAPAGFTYDPKSIKCQTFIYNGEKEFTALSHGQWYNKVIPGSQLIASKEHGHASIVLEVYEILLALVQGKAHVFP